jgi:hypothetical protein
MQIFSTGRAAGTGIAGSIFGGEPSFRTQKLVRARSSSAGCGCRQVEALAAYGIPEMEMDISRVVGIDPETLRKHHREELDLGATKANAQVAGFLFNSARNGNVTAQIFWLKCRARWKEPPAETRYAGAVATCDVSRLSDEQLLKRIAELAPIAELQPIPGGKLDS